MKPVRFGSYSSRSTTAGTSTLSRLKSTMRSAFLWPPPRKRTVMRPVLLRPPVDSLPSVRALTGFALLRGGRLTMTSWRWPGVVGLYVFSAIACVASESGGHVDAVALFEGHDRPLGVRLRTEIAAEHLGLALAHQRFDALDLDVEQLLDRFLDLRLGGLARHLEQHLVVLGGERRLLGHDRRDDD